MPSPSNWRDAPPEKTQSTNNSGPKDWRDYVPPDANYGLSRDQMPYMKVGPNQYVAPRFIPESYRNKLTVGEYPWLEKVQRETGIDTLQYIRTPDQDQSRGFWEDPSRIARYYHISQAAPKGWQAPDWLDTGAVRNAYREMERRNNGEPWWKWQQLAPNDELAMQLRGMAAPPNQYLWNSEQAYGVDPNQPWYETQNGLMAPNPILSPQEMTQQYYQQRGIERADWKELPFWQRAITTLKSPQPGAPGRPEASRLAASSVAGGMGVLPVVALGATLGLGAPAVAAIGVPIFLAGAYSAYTGQYVPGLSEIMQVMNIPEELFEKIIGLGVQAQADGLSKVLENLPAAWDAALLNYDTARMDLLNTVARLSGDETAGESEVWRFSEGYIDPVPLLNRERTGIGPRREEAMAEARERIADGEDPALVYVDFQDRFGDTGTFNDFVSSMLLDPLNFAPFIEGQLGSKIADMAGNKRLAAAFDAGRGNLLIDALPPGVQQLAEVAGRPFGLKSSDGLISAFNRYGDWVKGGYWPDGTKPINPATGQAFIPKVDQMTYFDRLMGGLDAQGRIKELQPYQQDTAWQKLQHMRDLTPDAQAGIFQQNLMDNIAASVADIAKSPDLDNAGKWQKLDAMLRQYANVDSIEVGQAGEAILGSPMTATLSPALHDFIKSEILDNFGAEWIADQPRIAMLENLAEMVGRDVSRLVEDLSVDPKGVLYAVMDAAQKNPDNPNAANILNDIRNGTMTPELLADEMSVFTGVSKGAAGTETIPSHAWRFEDMQARVLNAMFDATEDWLIKHFDLKPGSPFFRMSAVLKSAQSMLLLDLNPGYLINNGINNWVTMAAQGVFGFMTEKQVGDWMDRFGAKPSRLDVGVDPAGNTLAIGDHMGKIRKAVRGDDGLAKLQSQMNRARNKFGVASKLSSKMEEASSRSAYTIGMQKAWDQLWKPGTGFEKMPAMLEVQLRQIDPSLPDKIYGIVRGSVNMAEINAGLYEGAVRVNVSSLIDDAATRLAPDSPDRMREMLKATGMEQELANLLASAETARDVERAFATVRRKQAEYIDKLQVRDLVDAAAETSERVKAEGWPAAQDILTDMHLKIEDHWIRNLIENGEMKRKTDFMTTSERNAAWRAFRAEEQRGWNQMRDFELQASRGVLDAWGIDSEAAHQYLDVTRQRLQAWGDVYNGYEVDARTGMRISLEDAQAAGIQTRHVDGRNDLQRRYFATDYASKEARKVAWDTTQRQISELMNGAFDAEKAAQMQLDDFWGVMWEQQGQGSAARAWRQNVMNIRDEMRLAVTAFQDDMIQRGDDLDLATRRRLEQEFYEKTYQPLVARLKSEEIAGARGMGGQQAAVTGPDGTPPQAPAAPTTSVTEFADALKTQSETPYQPAPKDPAQTAVAAHADAVDVIAKSEAVKADAQTRYDAILTKEVVRNQLARVIGDQETIATMLAMELHAERWAEASGKKADAWWGEHIAGIESGDVGEGLFQVAPAPDTPAFREAFANTKVVDADGQPLVVYHGTNQGFEVFGANRDPAATDIKGYYFTKSPGDADMYAKSYGPIGANIQPVYLDIKNPAGPDVLKQLYQDTGWTRKRNGVEINAELIKRGYDGVVTNSEYIAFYPEQIKSKFNRGTWDMGDPNILNQFEKGSVKFLDDGRAIIRATKAADVSTMVHEIGHIFRRDMADPELGAIAQWGGLKDAAEYRKLQAQFDDGTISAANRKRYVDAEEKFARGFERYLAQDVNFSIPTQIKHIFKKFTNWLRGIYGKIEGSDIDTDIYTKVNVDGQEMRVKDIMDRMLFDEESIQSTQQNYRNAQAAIARGNRPAANPMDAAWSQAADWVMGQVTKASRRDDGAIYIRSFFETTADGKYTVIDTKPLMEALGLEQVGQDHYKVKDFSQVPYDAKIRLIQRLASEYGFGEMDAGDVMGMIQNATGNSVSDLQNIDAVRQIFDQRKTRAVEEIELAKIRKVEEQAEIQRMIQDPGQSWKYVPVAESTTPKFIQDEIRAMAGTIQSMLGEEFGSQKIMEIDPVTGRKTGSVDYQTRSSRWEGLISEIDRIYNSIDGTGHLTDVKRIASALQDIIDGKDTKNTKAMQAVKTYIEYAMGGGYETVQFDAKSAGQYLNQYGELSTKYISQANVVEGSFPYMVWTGNMDGAMEFYNRNADYMDFSNPAEINYLFGGEEGFYKFLDAMEEWEKTTAPYKKLIEHFERTRKLPFSQDIVDAPFQHGKYVIDSIVSGEDGQPVAYVPNRTNLMELEGAQDAEYFIDLYGREVDTRQGTMRILGLDPNDPNGYIYYTPDGQVRRSNDRTQLYQGAIDGGDVQARPGELFQASNPMGEAPAGSTPIGMHLGDAYGELANSHLKPLLDLMEQGAKDEITNGRQFKMSELDPQAQAAMQNWLKRGVENNMSGTKLATMRYGEQQRDMALLDYGRRYNIDNYLNVAFPYQLWYTRSMMNWAKRMIDKPAWFSMYARVREMQRKQEQKGIPSRLRGKIRVAAPYLPDWAGGVSYYDPFKQLFPFEQFLNTPLQEMQMDKSRQSQTAIEIMRSQMQRGEITQQEYDQAMKSKDGYVWNRAWTQAGADSENNGAGNPFNMVNMMMGPAMYITTPLHLMRGEPEKISQTPITRTASALQTVLKDTPLSAVGDLIGMVGAGPERALRKAANISEFGEWGDYYVERQLSNMAAEGIPVEQVMQAMMERQGPLWDQAYQRVQQEMALRVPGALQIEAMKGAARGQADVMNVMGAAMAGLHPQTVLPEGELAQRGISEEYSKAWNEYKAGNKQAIDQFFEVYPEYEARLALYKEPEERLRNHLVSEIWEKYGQLTGPNKGIAREQMGDAWETAFYNPETRDYTAIDIPTLAYWAKRLNGMVPRTPETQQIMDVPMYQQEPPMTGFYNPEAADDVQTYWSEKARLFPNIDQIQSGYYDNGRDRKYLKTYPILLDYWDWKTRYKESHPNVAAYMDDQAEKYSETSYGGSRSSLENSRQRMSLQEVQNMSPVLVSQLMGYFVAGQPMTAGARKELRRQWEETGRPGGTFDQYVESVVRSAFTEGAIAP